MRCIIECPVGVDIFSSGYSKVKGIILPGVGSAGATMDSLRKMGFLDVLEEKVLNDGVPFLGICIGLQILFDHSEEGDTECWDGFPECKEISEDKVRVPQIGWNEVKFIRNHAVISGLNESEFFILLIHIMSRRRMRRLYWREHSTAWISVQ